MISKYWLIVVLLTLLPSNSATTFGQAAGPPPMPVQVLHNSDVLTMSRNRMKADLIITRIVNSRCSFDIFPPVLQDLKRRGVPDAVLMMMTLVPNGPPHSQVAEHDGAQLPPQMVRLKLPAGLPILVETPYPISSADVREGNEITFFVVRPIYIDGVLTVMRGASAKARVVSVKKAQNWGRGGELTLQMEHIVAVDGTRIPVTLSLAAEGDNRAGQLVAGVALTSALVFPYTAPAAIVWGFKKGDDAVLLGSKQFSAILNSETEVLGLRLEKDRIIYHYAETLKDQLKTTSTYTAFPRLGIRN